ncbi:MAG: hypothetical protein IT196_27910 [Acidimicrobiales bacterium]|nr:hypothetical protein [Acidimicrobiales bacterium]
MNRIAAVSTGPSARVGCVVGVEVGVVRVLTDRGEVRASYGGRMLGLIARDRDVLPRLGEWVSLRRWSDGRITVEDCWAHRDPAGAVDATVIPLRRP